MMLVSEQMLTTERYFITPCLKITLFLILDDITISAVRIASSEPEVGALTRAIGWGKTHDGFFEPISDVPVKVSKWVTSRFAT